jgi:hypothetical protein
MRAILLLLLLTGCAGLREVPCYGVADEVGRRIVPGPDLNKCYVETGTSGGC